MDSNDLQTQPASPPTSPAPQNNTGFRNAALLLLGVACALGVIGLFSRNEKVNEAANTQPDNDRVISASANASGSRLNVTSEPPGASVLVNGRLAGSTPLALEGLAPGTYGVRLEKSGCKPISKSLALDRDVNLNEKMEPLPTGALTVDVKPVGAEVLLDGELIGHSPLTVDHIAAGTYELLIRKTNFDPYSVHIEISPGEPLAFSDFELKDKVLTMMEGLVKSEPQRLGHYIDLGHYLFVNDKLDESVDVFTQGMEVMQTPLDFNGAGYSGKDHMAAQEVEVEQRLRKEDESRFLKELEKHRNWPRKDIRVFRQKLDQAQELVSRKSVGSWTWAETAARMSIRSRNFDKAIQTLNDHIAAAPTSPDLPLAYVMLLEVHLMDRDVTKAREVFDKFMKLFGANDTALRACGSAMVSYQERMPQRGKAQLLEMADQALQKAVELTKDPVLKSQCQYDLAVVMTSEGKAKEAVPLFEKALAAAAADPLIHEERSLRLADALRKSGRLDEARELFNKLTSSERAATRESAKTGLIYIDADKAKQKIKQ